MLLYVYKLINLMSKLYAKGRIYYFLIFQRFYLSNFVDILIAIPSPSAAFESMCGDCVDVYLAGCCYCC